jgi:DNA mismatch repair ATPase MutS
MAVTTIIKEIKKVHPNEVVLVRIGEFFHIYGKDAYIISYLFGYKIQTVEHKIYMSGFPKKALNKIMVKLEDKKSKRSMKRRIETSRDE